MLNKMKALIHDSKSSSKIMGILNVTPDSFSDGGLYHQQQLAIEHAQLMIEEGADIIDIGAESTKPGAVQVPVNEEIDRLLSIVEALLPIIKTPISIDTMKSKVMKQVLQSGAVMINDVNGLQDVDAMEICAKYDACVCIMHMQNNPKTMQVNPVYNDVVNDVKTFLENRVQASLKAGIDSANIIVDAGIGFGKTTTHNVQLLNNLDTLSEHPVLLGVSRKSFIGKITGQELPSQRIIGSVTAAMYGLNKGVGFLRVHDVAQTKEAIKVWEYLRNNND